VDWWVYLLALVAVVAVAVGAAFLGRWLYARQVRRSLVRLLRTREAVVAGAKGLDLVIAHLAGQEDDGEALEVFASDAASEDRRAVADVAARMRILADDLHAMALPKRLWVVAEDMERAARTLAEQAGGVGEAATPAGALDALAAIRMEVVREQARAADTDLQPLLEAFRVYDPAVYGGGLYI
jgi:hypothetical protein